MTDKPATALVEPRIEITILERVRAFIEELHHAQTSGAWDGVFQLLTDLARDLAGGYDAELMLWADSTSVTPNSLIATTSPGYPVDSPLQENGPTVAGIEPAVEEKTQRYALKWQGLNLGILTIYRHSAYDPADPTPATMLQLVIDQFCAYWGSLIKEQILREQPDHNETLEIVQNIGDILTSSLNVDDVLRNITDTLPAIFNAEACSVLVCDRQAGGFRLLASNRIEKEAPDGDKLYGLKDSLVGWIAQHPTAVYIEDVSVHSHYNPGSDHLPGLERHDLLATPLRYRDEVIGVIELANKKGGHFDNIDVQLLQRITPGAAIALENARLFNKIYEEQRLQAEFVAVASHALRSPLMSITTAAEWVLARARLEARSQERIHEIQKQAFMLSQFVGEILDVSQIEAGKLHIYPEPVSLLPFVRQAVKTFTIRSPYHHIKLIAPPKVPHVLADANKLDIILDHLLDNAVHYSPPGSEITVEVETTQPGALIRVVDQGAGIPEDVRPFIFDKFNRGARDQERKTRGLGLGLYIVRRLVEEHKGDIWVESEEGKGSKFCFTLPWFSEEVKIS
ncbi:MAG: ATP-binding protein [Anaerolineae bacterium]